MAVLIDYTSDFKASNAKPNNLLKRRLEDEGERMTAKRAEFCREMLEFSLIKSSLNRNAVRSRKVQKAHVRTASVEKAAARRDMVLQKRSTSLENRLANASQQRATLINYIQTKNRLMASNAQVVADETSKRREAEIESLKVGSCRKHAVAAERRQALLERTVSNSQKHNNGALSICQAHMENTMKQIQQLAVERQRKNYFADCKRATLKYEKKRKSMEHNQRVNDTVKNTNNKENEKIESLTRTMDLKSILAEANHSHAIFEKKRIAEKNTESFVRCWATRWERLNALEAIKEAENDDALYF